MIHVKNTIEYIHRNNMAYRQYCSGRTKLSTPPIAMWLETTNRCNLRCVKCAHHYGLGRPLGNMERRLFTHMIHQARGNVHHLTVNGVGEALLHPELFQMIREAKEAGIPQVFLHTNATLLSEKRSWDLLESGLDSLMISFDSEFPDEYERIHRGAGYEKTLSNILRLLAMKKRRGPAGPMIAIKIVRVFEPRAEQRDPDPNFLKLFRGLPVDRIYTAPIHATGSYTESLRKVRSIASGAADPRKGKRYVPCLRPYTGISITWDGKAMACFQDYRNEYEGGDLTRHSLMDVWNGSAMRELRGRLMAGPGNLPSPCSECSTTWRSGSNLGWQRWAVKSWFDLPRVLTRYHAPLLRRKICEIPVLNRKLGVW